MPKKMTELEALEVVLEGMTQAMGVLNKAYEECRSQNARHYLAEPKKVLNNAIAQVNEQIVKANFFSQEVKE